MIFGGVVIDWDGFTVDTDPPAKPAVGLNARRTCPTCNDENGQVVWYGTRTCPWCGFNGGEPL